MGAWRETVTRGRVGPTDCGVRAARCSVRNQRRGHLGSRKGLLRYAALAPPCRHGAHLPPLCRGGDRPLLRGVRRARASPEISSPPPHAFAHGAEPPHGLARPSTCRPMRHDPHPSAATIASHDRALTHSPHARAACRRTPRCHAARSSPRTTRSFRRRSKGATGAHICTPRAAPPRPVAGDRCDACLQPAPLWRGCVPPPLPHFPARHADSPTW